MGFFTNFEKANIEKLGGALLREMTYHSQDSGNITLDAWLNVRRVMNGNYVEQRGEVGVFIADVTVRTGDSITDPDGRLWYIEAFIEQKEDMAYYECYADSEARYQQ